MHQYLRDEEAVLLSQLKDEEKEKIQRMKEKIDRINNDIRLLTNSIQETEEALGLDDILFLKVSIHRKFQEQEQFYPSDQA